MSKSIVQKLFFLVFFWSWSVLAAAQSPVWDASARVLGGPLNYYSSRPGAFWGNPANLGLNAWNRVGLHVNRAYGFNAFVANGFVPGWGHLGASVNLDAANAQCIQVGIARRLSGPLSFGGRLDFMDLTGEKNVLADVGAVYTLGPLSEDVFPLKISLGGHISQINLKQNHGSTPVVHLGGQFSFSNHLIEIFPNFSFSKRGSHFGLGFSFFPIAQIALRVGSADLKREKISAGIGFEAARYALDAAYEPAWRHLHISFSVLIGPSPEQRARNLFDAGKAALEKHQLNDALKDFRKAWAYNPDNSFYQKSYKLIERRLQLQKSQLQALMNKALKYQQQGYFFLAATQYLEVLKKSPDYQPARVRLNALRPLVANDVKRLLKKGEDYLNKGELEIARQIFQKILLLDSGNKKARALMAKIEEKSRAKADEYFYRGLGYYSQRNLKRAESEFQKALEIDPNYEEARVYLNEIEKNNRRKRAEVDSLLRVATKREDQKRYADAIDNYIRVLDLEPENGDAKTGVKRLNAYVKKQIAANLRRSRSALKRANFSQANRYLRRVLKIFPKNKQALALRDKIEQAKTIRYNELLDKAEEARHNGRLADALTYYKKAQAVRPGDKKLKKTIRDVQGELELTKNLSLGEAAFNRGDFATAISYFERVLRTNPENNVAAAYLRRSRQKLKEQVKSLLQKGIELYTKENYPGAIEVFAELLKLDPNNKVAAEYYHRSVVKQKAIDNLK